MEKILLPEVLCAPVSAESCSIIRNTLLLMAAWRLSLFSQGTGITCSGDFPGHLLLRDVLCLLLRFYGIPSLHPHWSVHLPSCSELLCSNRSGGKETLGKYLMYF